FSWDYGSGILGYNKDLFDQAKQPYPTDQWTMDDLRAAAKAITKPSDKIFGFDQVPESYTFEQWFGPWGAAAIDETETKGKGSTIEAQRALQFWTDMRLVDKSIPMAADFEALKALGARPFHTGKLAMTLTYLWDAGETAKYAKFKWDVALWPKGPA